MTNNKLMKAALLYAPKPLDRTIPVAQRINRKGKAPGPDFYKLVVAQCRCCLAMERVVYKYSWSVHKGKFVASISNSQQETDEDRTEVINIDFCDVCLDL